MNNARSVCLPVQSFYVKSVFGEDRRAPLARVTYASVRPSRIFDSFFLSSSALFLLRQLSLRERVQIDCNNLVKYLN